MASAVQKEVCSEIQHAGVFFLFWRMRQRTQEQLAIVVRYAEQ